MAARAHLVHRLPGRVRLSVLARRGDRAFFAELHRRLSAAHGIRAVETSAVTGSVLLRHDGDFDQLATALLGSDVGELMELTQGSPPLARLVHHDVANLDRAIQRWSGGALDLGTFAALGLAAVAGLRAIRGPQRLQAVTLAWYAAELITRSPHARQEVPAHTAR